MDCTHLLFVDADIDFAAADIFALIGAMMARPDCEILGAAVPRRTVNWPQVARAAERGVATDNAADLARFDGDFALSFLTDRKSVVEGKSGSVRVVTGGGRLLNNKIQKIR